MKPGRYMVFLSMGFELVGLVLASVFLGQKLDDMWGTKGLVLIFLTLATLGGWMVHLVFLLRQIERAEARDEKKREETR